MTKPVEPFDIPESVIIDKASGYSINIPMFQQGVPYPFLLDDGVYDNILAQRKAQGITIGNDFPDSVDGKKIPK